MILRVGRLGKTLCLRDPGTSKVSKVIICTSTRVRLKACMTKNGSCGKLLIKRELSLIPLRYQREPKESTSRLNRISKIDPRFLTRSYSTSMVAKRI